MSTPQPDAILVPVFNVADPATWPVLLNVKHLAALFNRTPGGILRACSDHKFCPAPCQTHPTLWRRVDVLRHIEGARGVSPSLWRVSAIVLLLLLPATAFAQDAPIPPPESRGALLTGLYAGYIAAQLGDIDSTRRFLSVGLREGNPAMKGCVGAGMKCIVPLKVGVTAGVLLLVDQAIRPTSRQAAIAQMLVLNALQWVVTGTNYSVYFSAKGRQR